MEEPQIDMLAVILAALVGACIGAVWYSRWLFGPVWQRLALPRPRRKSLQIAAAIASSLCTAWILGFFEAFLGVTTVSDGMFAAALAWFGFTATTQIAPVVWRGEPLRLFYVDSGYRLLAYLSMGGILGA